MPNAKPVKMTLFHANWCGHCTDFMPTWNAMKSNRSAKKNIEFVDYEESQMKGLSKEDRQIEGFPTIKISIHGKTYNYMGKRNQEDIFGFVVTKIRNMVTGNVTSSSASNRSITASSEPSIHSEPMQGGNMQFSATSDDPTYKSYKMRGGSQDQNMVFSATSEDPRYKMYGGSHDQNMVFSATSEDPSYKMYGGNQDMVFSATSEDPNYRSYGMRGGSHDQNMVFSATSEDPSHRSYGMRGGSHDQDMLFSATSEDPSYKMYGGNQDMIFSATSEDPSYKSYRMRGGNYDTVDDDIRGPIPEEVQAHFDNASRLPAGALEQESASMPELLDLLVGGNNPPNPLNDIPLLRVSEH